MAPYWYIFSVYFLGHRFYLKGLFVSWTESMCFLRFPLWVKPVLQNSHFNGFSSTCIVRICKLRLLFCPKLVLQGSHLKGFWPSCAVTTWFLRCSLREKLVSHVSHLNGLLRSWTKSLCFFIGAPAFYCFDFFPYDARAKLLVRN